MTDSTIGRESCCPVIRISRRIVILGMTAVTVARQIVPSLMTLGTFQLSMRSLQHPDGGVIEGGPLPRNRSCSMTDLAIGRKIERLVVGIVCPVVVFLMTGDAL